MKFIGLKERASPFGVYIHLPFCAKRCGYCDFYSVSLNRRKDREALIESYFGLLKKELFYKAPLFSRFGEVGSIYFGGGTPSLAPPHLIAELITLIWEEFGLIEGAEITLEANPESLLAKGRIEAFLGAGVNRLSVGVQSLKEEELKTLGRIHTAGEAQTALIKAREAGFKNISADLIFGVPGQTVSDVIGSIETISKIGVKHLSVYELTLEHNPPIKARLKQNGLTLPGEEKISEAYPAIIKALRKRGFERYEVSNYAKNKAYSRHNLLYWFFKPYMGLGASAHSMLPYADGIGRFASPADLGRYKNFVEAGAKPRVTVSRGKALFNEFLIAPLRTAEGFSVAECEEMTGLNIEETLGETLAELIANGLLKPFSAEKRIIAAEKGFMLLNEIATRLSL